MILAVDVGYNGNSARVAGILFSDWRSDTILQQLVFDISPVADYISGSFYLRELPCIETLLEKLEEPPNCVILDGYVCLGAEGTPGFGLHLWNSVKGQFPVIGVAKTEFAGTPENMKVLRGESNKPLFVSSIGMDLEEAKENIRSMACNYRLPTILKQVDHLSKSKTDPIIAPASP